MDEKIVSLTPDIGIYASFKRISYTIPSALAEFVDNSIDSFLENGIYLEETKLKVEIDYFYNIYYPERNEIIICDNAFGMNFGELKEALKLQGQTKHKKNEQRIGEYGLGLKYAATWFSNLWKIETTQKNSNKKYIVTMDINKFVKEKNANVEIKTEECSRNEHYTSIKLCDLSRNISLNDSKKIEDEFQKLYGTKIYNQELEIFVSRSNVTDLNNRNKESFVRIEAGDFGKDKNVAYNRHTNQYYSWKIEDEININNQNYKFDGQIHLSKTILPQPGLYLFKKGRLIEICYPKNVFGNGNPRKRIYGKIFLSNNWPVAQTKDKISWEGESEEKFWKKLLNFFKKPRSQFNKKNIFYLVDEIKKEEDTNANQKKIANILKRQWWNNDLFTLEKTNQNFSHQKHQNQKELQSRFSPINLSFINQRTNQKEKLNVLFDEKEKSSQPIKVIKSEKDGLTRTDLIFYLNNTFFQKFEKKVIKPETKSLLIKLFHAFAYSVSITGDTNLETIVKHLNKSLLE